MIYDLMGSGLLISNFEENSILSPLVLTIAIHSIDGSVL